MSEKKQTEKKESELQANLKLWLKTGKKIVDEYGPKIEEILTLIFDKIIVPLSDRKNELMIVLGLIMLMYGGNFLFTFAVFEVLSLVIKILFI